MEGSSESAWQRSNSSRDLNTSRVSYRNPRLNHTRRFGFLGGSSQDSDLRNERDGVVVAHTVDLKTRVDYLGCVRMRCKLTLSSELLNGGMSA